MLFKDRLYKFFISAYQNAPKFNSSYLQNLRLLFERNSKLDIPKEVIGNVFRNSK